MDTSRSFIDVPISEVGVLHFLLITTLAILLWFAALPWFRLRYEHVPGYWGWPLIGNLLEIKATHWHGLHQLGLKKFGTVFKLWHGTEPHIVTASTEVNKQVLSKCPIVFEFPSPMWGDDRRMLTDSLAFVRDMSHHKRLRSIWAPAFQPAQLARHYAVMVQQAQKLADSLEEVADTGRAVDIWRLFCKMSIAVVGTTAFGVDVDFGMEDLPIHSSSSNSNSSRASPPGLRVLHAFQKILQYTRPSQTGLWMPLHLMTHPVLRGIIRILANWFPDSTMRGLRYSQSEIREVIKGLIHEERQRMQIGQGGLDVSPGIDTGSFLHHLLYHENKAEEGPPMTDMELIANIYAYLGGGAETPANAMSYTIYLLAQHPHLQDRVLEEVSLSKPTSVLDYAELGKACPYLEACFFEAMRLLPPVSKLLREAPEDILLTGTSIKVPKGTKFQVSLLCALHEEKVWTQPAEFVPERFMKEVSGWSNPDNLAYMPFGGGVRLCPGYKYAQNMAKVTLATLFQRYRFDLEVGTAPLRVSTGLTMSPEHGVLVRVCRRNNST